MLAATGPTRQLVDWGPRRPERFRCTEHHEFEISELGRCVGDALERLNVKLTITREWEQPALSDFRFTQDKQNRRFAISCDELKRQITLVGADTVSAEHGVSAELRMERRSWWRKLFGLETVEEKPNGYSPRLPTSSAARRQKSLASRCD